MRKNHKKKSKFSIKKFYTQLWDLLKDFQGQIKLLIVLIILLEIVSFGVPYLLKLIIDLLANFEKENLSQMLYLILGIFLFGETSVILHYIKDKKIFNFLVNIEKFLTDKSHKRLLFLDLAFHEKENTGNKITKIQRGVVKIDELFSHFFWEVLPTMFQLLFTVVILFAIDWRFGVVILVFSSIFITLSIKLNKEAHPYREEGFVKQEKAFGIMAQNIININTVKSYAKEDQELKQFKSLSQEIKNAFRTQLMKIGNYNVVRGFLIDLGRALLLIFAVYLAYNGEITVGSVVFVFTISEKALLSSYRISRIYDRIMDSSEAIQRFNDLFKQEPAIKNPKNGLMPKPTEVKGQIEFKNVEFAYGKKEENALHKVNAKINSGQVTALVGPSGGGKTTLARMVYRHYDPQKGRVLLDGKNLKEYDLYNFRRAIAIVPQEVEIFNASVKENIAYANPKASMKEVKEAARIANAEEFIDKLKDGYNTLVGERGIKLSGGQRQRVGIARAILANPRILIFDEATSNLDSHSEQLIQKAMDRISQNRTTIIIAHRLSTIQKADNIIVLENGQIAEQGTHASLAQSQGGLYHKLLQLQNMGEVS